MGFLIVIERYLVTRRARTPRQDDIMDVAKRAHDHSFQIDAIQNLLTDAMDACPPTKPTDERGPPIVAWLFARRFIPPIVFATDGEGTSEQ
jgi:hypothetical protein